MLDRIGDLRLRGPCLLCLEHLFAGLDALLTGYGPSTEMSCGVATAGEEYQATALARDLFRRGETAFPEQSAV